MNRKTVFFDRDGVVNYRPVGDYVKSIDEFIFVPDLFRFFQKIKEKGYLAVLISNQQGVGKGLMSVEDLTTIHNYMQEELKAATGFQFDDIYYCTELASEGSIRRKPNPGMLLEAIKKWNIDIANSWMIGDSVNDILAGQRAGVKTILVTTESFPDNTNPDIVCKSLSEIEI